jgi:hypothetical protein
VCCADTCKRGVAHAIAAERGEAASAAEQLEARAKFDGPERDFRGGVFNDVVPGFGVVPESVDFRANVVRAGLNYKFDWYRPFVTIGTLGSQPQPLHCHAPLQAGHPVISARQVEAKPCQIGLSVVTGSSAYADDDDRECGNPP